MLKHQNLSLKMKDIEGFFPLQKIENERSQFGQVLWTRSVVNVKCCIAFSSSQLKHFHWALMRLLFCNIYPYHILQSSSRSNPRLIKAEFLGLAQQTVFIFCLAFSLQILCKNMFCFCALVKILFHCRRLSLASYSVSCLINQMCSTATVPEFSQQEHLHSVTRLMREMRGSYNIKVDWKKAQKTLIRCRRVSQRR